MTCRWSRLKHFRQLGSMTPGHPEYGITPGVETTTGPLGQGVGNGIGMAIAAKHLRARFERDKSGLFDHRVFGICGDGDLMEGVASEAASIAGHLGLGNLIYIYDDNHITIDGGTDLSFDENVCERFNAYGWHTQGVDDANDLAAVAHAIENAIAEENRPSLIRVRSHIGYGSPNRQDTSKAHGQALGVEEVKLTKRFYGWPEEPAFYVPDEALKRFRDCGARGRELESRMEWPLRALRQGARERGRGAQVDAGGRAAEGMGRRAAAVLAQGYAGHPRVGLAGRAGDREESLEPVRRRGRPERIDFRRRGGRRRFRAPRLPGTQPALRHPRARDVRDLKRRRTARRLHPLRLELPHLHRLLPALAQAGGADGRPRDLHLHPRFDWPGRRWPDSSGGRTALGAARHSRISR